ncbi:MAG: hypothetical protein ACRBM6_04400 [Geminicoccales bacterium]
MSIALRPSIFVATYTFDHMLSIWCRNELSVVELECWWHEISLDYGVVLMTSNDNLAVLVEGRNRGADVR